MSLFYTVVSVLLIILSVLLLYTLILIPFSFKKVHKAAKGDKFHKIALVISARNEENVIGHLLDSLNDQDYPREAFDIFIIIDNCTDDTERVAKEKGAITYVRNDKSKIGKGHALHWFFTQFNRDYEGVYDAIGVFDADNLVDKNFLSVMNDQLCNGEVAAMGYRDSKNPYDTWVSGCMSLLWYTLSRFGHQARTNVGLSASFGGTGYVFKTEFIKDGWNTTSICEDTEISMQVICKGHRIAYAPDAKFYDEQPIDWMTSIHQRYRWALGSYHCVKTSVPSLFCALFKARSLRALDGVMFIILPIVVGIQMLTFVLSLTNIFFRPVETWAPSIAVSALMLLVGAIGIILQGLLVLILERKPIKPMINALLHYPIFLAFSGFLNLLVLFYRNNYWRPIKHVKVISLSEVNFKKK